MKTHGSEDGEGLADVNQVRKKMVAHKKRQNGGDFAKNERERALGEG